MKKGEIWLVQFPSRKGREQAGLRPSIVLADTKTDLALLISLTSNLEALKKFPYTLKIMKSFKNRLGKDSVALVFQLQSLDKKRLIHKIGDIEKNILKLIDKNIKDLIRL